MKISNMKRLSDIESGTDLDKFKFIDGIPTDLAEKLFSIIRAHYEGVKKFENEDIRKNLNVCEQRVMRDFFAGYLAACKNLTWVILGKEKLMDLCRK